MPLLVTDDNGNTVYKSRSVKQGIALGIAAQEQALVAVGGHVALCKDIRIAGSLYHFYMEADRLKVPHGARVRDVLARLFSLEELAAEPPKTFSLPVLPRLLADTYGKTLRQSGIQLEVRRLKLDATVSVPVNALLLSLALMVQLCAARGKHVCLSALPTENGATVFADAAIEKSDAPVPLVLNALLCEVAGAAGFQVQSYEKNGMATWELTLCPPDIGLLGFKAPTLAGYETNCRAYAAVLLQ